MQNVINLRTAGLVAVKDGQLLLAYSRNKQAWYLPGGKVDPGETTVEALVREIREELSTDLDPARLQLFCHIHVSAFGEDAHVWIDQDCFLYELEHPIIPGSEIEAIAYFSPAAYAREPRQVIGTLQVFEKLREKGLV